MSTRCEFVPERVGWRCSRMAVEGEKFCKEHLPGSPYIWVSLGEEKGIERGYYRQRRPDELVEPEEADAGHS